MTERRTTTTGITSLVPAGLFPAFWLFVRLILGWEWLRAGWDKLGDSGP